MLNTENTIKTVLDCFDLFISVDDIDALDDSNFDKIVINKFKCP